MMPALLPTYVNHPASVIAVLQLTGSVINTCYHHQLRRDRNASIDLKPTIDQLRGFGDVLHRLYTAMDGDDPNGPPQSSSISNQIDCPLLQCTTELHALESII